MVKHSLNNTVQCNKIEKKNQQRNGLLKGGQISNLLCEAMKIN